MPKSVTDHKYVGPGGDALCQVFLPLRGYKSSSDGPIYQQCLRSVKEHWSLRDQNTHLADLLKALLFSIQQQGLDDKLGQAYKDAEEVYDDA